VNEIEYEGPIITVTPPMVLNAEEIVVQDEINLAQNHFADGAVNMVNGTLQMLHSLVQLREDDLYKQSPLVTHYDESPGWKTYLRELVAWSKERNPEVQISMSGLQGLLWRHKVLVEHFGFNEQDAIGMHESNVRQIRKMVKFDYKDGRPVELKDGYRLELLPIPPDTPKEKRLEAGVKTVIEDTMAQPVISPKTFDSYKSGTGQVETQIGFAMELDDEARVKTWTAFVQVFNEEGAATKDYAVNLLREPMPCEVADALIDCRWNVEYL